MNEPAADRRERYAAALLGPDAAGSLDSAADELIDAVMAVADAELAAVPPADQTADRAALRDRIADALAAKFTSGAEHTQGMRVAFEGPDGWPATRMVTPIEAADAVLAVLPEPADRAAVLREAAARYEEILAKADTAGDPRYWTAVRDITLGLRHMAAEAQQGAATAFAPSAPGANEPASSVAAEAQPTTQPDEDPARIDRLRPEFFEHASVESIDLQIQRARRQQRHWGNRERTLAILRQARIGQKARGEWPAAGVRQDGAQP